MPGGVVPASGVLLGRAPRVPSYPLPHGHTFPKHICPQNLNTLHCHTTARDAHQLEKLKLFYYMVYLYLIFTRVGGLLMYTVRLGPKYYECTEWISEAVYQVGGEVMWVEDGRSCEANQRGRGAGFHYAT